MRNPTFAIFAIEASDKQRRLRRYTVSARSAEAAIAHMRRQPEYSYVSDEAIPYYRPSAAEMKQLAREFNLKRRTSDLYQLGTLCLRRTYCDLAIYHCLPQFADRAEAACYAHEFTTDHTPEFSINNLDDARAALRARR